MVKPTLFIGSSTLAISTAQLVKAELSRVAEAYIWNDDMFGLNISTFESLLSQLDRLDFAVLIFTPDDPSVVGNQTIFKPRDNVLIEFGLFTGGLGQERTFAMRPAHELIHMPSDIAGVTVADLKPCNEEGQRYDVKEGCEKIANAIKAKGHRPRVISELGVLYRLVNAFTFPNYPDVHVPVLDRSGIKYNKNGEKFETIGEVVDFLGELLSDYVYPQLLPSQLETMRIYFAFYLGDGIMMPRENVSEEWDPRGCIDSDNDGKEFEGEFVIGLANPAEIVSEMDWRVGHAIKGFSGVFPLSMCAKAFDSGDINGFRDLGMIPQGLPNYKTPNELSVFSFPVEWRSEMGAGRIGVITISAQRANSIKPELMTLMNLLANIIGFVFSLFAVSNRINLGRAASKIKGLQSARGFSKVKDTEQGRMFAEEVAALRRMIAGHFENSLLAQQKHIIKDGRICCSLIDGDERRNM
ncbi:TIR domain-containing protein [Synechococcus sp. BA-132 BA5]|uniref:TIR domain-containing protein n=1 Tax=Synechococcus sp. BA-132 BA5 TaxID=3110252 RepID=UPI002B1FBC09|nr:TIR domain-containing protein [Synechococcus sp. BA-132 BA5]MEA5414230.1 TIR domain-containing protein [Synechococcus sp. BA-132 BA5]